MARNRRNIKSDGCCSANFLKYLVFIYNFIFYIAGFAILGFGLWTIFEKSSYIVLLASATYTILAYFLICAGFLCILIGVIGCVGLTKDSRRCILIFAICLLVIFLMEAAAGVMAYVYSEQVEKEVQMDFQEILKNSYGVDPSVTEAADLLHKKYGCCGAKNFKDWRNSAWYNKTNFEKQRNFANTSGIFTPHLKVPHVCCKTINKLTCGERDHPSNIYYGGCVSVLTAELKEHVVMLGGLACGISTIQIFGIIISCCLYAKLKDAEARRHSRRKKRTYDDDY